ncbi:Shr3 amino acid permease chaperone [Collybia nuda]|uniref:Shr3 amino acid permease chaperone n=1 Tax=Collybia nuda TaxID=64659 RepID=A0A9P6CCI7_9AGAR|nr:Shr3 amino acid permease chaperone [Collybia nuda]
MGVRSGVVVCVTSFLLGSLFTHWIADSLTLWKSPVTDEHLWTAASYYSILAKGPPEILYFLTAIVLIGGITILWSLRDGEAGNIMFDGGSIFLFGTSIVMYLYSVLPSLGAKFTSLPTHQLLDPFPRTLRHATLELASNNLICSVALTGVLALQAGRFWAESSDNDEDEYEEVEVDGVKSRAKTPDLRSEKPPAYQRINDTS